MRRNSKETIFADVDEISREIILETVAAAPELLTFGNLEKILRKTTGFRRDNLKRAVDELVAEGELVYSYRYGCSFLEKSFERPVRVSERIVLAPFQTNFTVNPGGVVIKIKSGISFGKGDHPTTRLGLRCIDYIFRKAGFEGSTAGATVLDIGTGSGILAIACVLLGAGGAKGIDTDPCARKEAEDNAAINGIGDRMEISGMLVEEIEGRFSVITANLRSPTLINLHPVMMKLAEKDSVLVFSGIKKTEVGDILRLYTMKHFEILKEEHEKDWSALVLASK